MKIINICSLALILLVLASCLFISQANDVLTLKKCYDLALKKNINLTKAKKNVEEAKASLLGSYADKYPSLRLSGGYSLGGGSTSSNTRHSYSTSLSGSYQLFNGGQTDSTIELARLSLSLAEESFMQESSQLAYSIEENFYRLLQKSEQIKIAKEIEKRKDDNLLLVNLRYKAGKENQQAVKEAEADLYQSEYDSLVAQENLKQSKYDLNALLGQPLNTDIQISYKQDFYKIPLKGQLLKEAMAYRPDIKLEKINLIIQEERLRQAKKGYAPSVSLSTSFGWQSDGLIKNWDNSWSASGNISYSLFDGFSTKYNIQEAEFSLGQEKDQLEDLKIQIENEIEQAIIDFTLSEKKLGIGEKVLKVAEEVYILTKLQYKQGLTTYFFLQQKENVLAQSQRNHINDLYNYRLAHAKLKKVWGISKL